VRAESALGDHPHAQVLIGPAVAATGMHQLPALRTAGVRAVTLGAVRFRDCRVGLDRVLGWPQAGLRIPSTPSPLADPSRLAGTVLAAMAVAIVDTGLRTTVRHVAARKLYGKAVIDLPYIRSVLVSAFVDLLVCDAFATVAARAAHVAPASLDTLAPAVQHALSVRLASTMRQLSVVLGAHFYIREGDHSVFQKLLRDLMPASLGHAGRLACELAILPRLPGLAGRATGEPAPPELFRLDEDLPSLLRPPPPTGHLPDQLTAALTNCLDTGPGGSAELRQVRGLAEHFRLELAGIALAAADLPEQETKSMAGPATHELATRYITVLMAGVCMGLWHEEQHRASSFLADPSWLTAALTRLSAASPAQPAALPEDVEQRLLAELLDRYESARAFGVHDTQLAGP